MDDVIRNNKYQNDWDEKNNLDNLSKFENCLKSEIEKLKILKAQIIRAVISVINGNSKIL